MQNIGRHGQGNLLMFILQESPIDPVQARNMYRNPVSGGIVIFEGVVRADEHQGRVVSELLYVADNPACIAEGEKIIKEAFSKFPITEAVCIQRIGQLKTTETAVWIGVWAGHRDEAFKGCRYIIEEIKKRLLIWKKEFYTDGSSAWIRGSQPVNP
jgi:molybdopterin synthase catalytic subunit